MLVWNTSHWMCISVLKRFCLGTGNTAWYYESELLTETVVRCFMHINVWNSYTNCCYPILCISNVMCLITKNIYIHYMILWKWIIDWRFQSIIHFHSIKQCYQCQGRISWALIYTFNVMYFILTLVMESFLSKLVISNQNLYNSLLVLYHM